MRTHLLKEDMEALLTELGPRVTRLKVTRKPVILSCLVSQGIFLIDSVYEGNQVMIIHFVISEKGQGTGDYDNNTEVPLPCRGLGISQAPTHPPPLELGETPKDQWLNKDRLCPGQAPDHP